MGPRAHRPPGLRELHRGQSAGPVAVRELRVSPDDGAAHRHGQAQPQRRVDQADARVRTAGDSPVVEASEGEVDGEDASWAVGCY